MSLPENKCSASITASADLSRLAESPAADEAVLAEQGLEGWAANLDAEDR